MNTEELKEFMEARKPSPSVARKEVLGLICYGCAHSASMAPPPGMPSGERPCCSCVRNPETESMLAERIDPVVGDDGHARVFDPFAGTMYNGAPRVYFPSDNYVTMDSHDQNRFMDQHPEYTKPVRFVNGELKVMNN
jgi:hypothetical protein